MLVANFSKQLGTLKIEIELAVPKASSLVLVGESGAGKTSALNILAGIIQPETGRIAVGDAVYFDSEAGIAVPANRRAIGYLFQDYALFPHLSVFENVAFGLRARGVRDSEVRELVRNVLRQLRIAALAETRPQRLSGGQQQRVALARAVVLEPQLLLLDEPLSALDVATRREVRSELQAILATASCATLFVTHSPFEALVFGGRIAVMEKGRIVQVGSREDLLERPRSRYVAELMGLNFFRGKVRARDATGLVEVNTAHGMLHVIEAVEGEEVFIAVDPREITLYPQRPSGSAQNLFCGRILQLVPEPPFGERVRVILETEPPLVAIITAHAVESLGLHQGMEIYAGFKATAARHYT